MSRTYIKEVAGLQFRIMCDRTVLLREPDRYNEAFVINADTKMSTDRDVRIRLEIGDVPNIEAATPIFDGGQSWALYQDDTATYLVLYAAALQETLWLAKCESDFTQVTVYCSHRLVEHHAGQKILKNPVSYPLLQILSMYVLASREGLLIHAAGIELDGSAYIFPGKSGAGKSTITRLLTASKTTCPLSDDRIAVRRTPDGFTAYGTPWPGEASIAVNAAAPLRALFFLQHGDAHEIVALERREALERLLPVVSIPWYDRRTMLTLLGTCDLLLASVPAYELRFTPDVEVEKMLKKFLAGSGPEE